MFDRCYEHSIKEETRRARAGNIASYLVLTLFLSTPLPALKNCRTVTENKCQLISLICQYFDNHPLSSSRHRLVITGPDPIPVEYFSKDIKPREDLRTTHEEADVIIAQQAVALKTV